MSVQGQDQHRTGPEPQGDGAVLGAVAHVGPEHDGLEAGGVGCVLQGGECGFVLLDKGVVSLEEGVELCVVLVEVGAQDRVAGLPLAEIVVTGVVCRHLFSSLNMVRCVWVFHPHNCRKTGKRCTFAYT